MDLVEPTWPEFQGAVRGFVTEAPTALGAPFEVVVPSFSTDHGYEIRRWSARGLTKPAVGDEVLVVEDDSGLPWVPAWWPAGGDVGLQEALPTHPHDFGIVTALPTKEPAPAAGDLCKFKAATGVYWHLLYTAEATYPWAKIGGPPLNAPGGGSPSTASSVYQTVSAPTTTLPLAMEFDAFMESNISNGTATLNGVRIATFINGVEGASVAVTLPASSVLVGSWRQRASGEKGKEVGMRYKSESSLSATFFGLTLQIDPLRVG